jgi:hypothetical protein
MEFALLDPVTVSETGSGEIVPELQVTDDAVTETDASPTLQKVISNRADD